MIPNNYRKRLIEKEIENKLIYSGDVNWTGINNYHQSSVKKIREVLK